MKNANFPNRQKAGKNKKKKKAAILKLKKILALNIRYYFLYSPSYKSKYLQEYQVARQWNEMMLKTSSSGRHLDLSCEFAPE